MSDVLKSVLNSTVRCHMFHYSQVLILEIAGFGNTPPEKISVQYRLITFSGGTFLRGVQGNPNYFPILVQGDAVHGISSN